MYLNCHSYYSLRYGTIPPEQLPVLARNHGIETLVLTDINCSTGVFDFYRACLNAGVRPIAGIEFRSEPNTQRGHLLYTAIALNNRGFMEINEFLTHHNLSRTPLPLQAPPFSNAFVIYPPERKKESELRENEFTGTRLSELNRLLLRPKEELRKRVFFHPVTFSGGKQFKLHLQLRAIAHNCLLSHLPPGSTAHSDEHFAEPEILREKLSPFPTLEANTRRILDQAGLHFDLSTVKNKQTFTGNKYDDKLLLEKLALDGLKYRYGENNREARRRVEHELEIIENLGFSSYFLITWDIIRYSMSRGFYHVGRGSGANSVVAYCLKITDVCPIELDLYFERFLNPKRKSPPDFDIDYSWKERDEVLDYIFKRYGHKHTALLGTISTFKDRSVPRELGKVHGLPKSEIDHLVHDPGDALARNNITTLIESFRGDLESFPNLRSIHAGGVLISEEPITAYTALDLPPKNFPTAQFDMYIAEDIGFEKLDILSQRGIGHIRECADIVYRNRGTRIDVHDVTRFKNDPKVKAQLKSGDTIGCFYVESPAMRGLLKKLRCDNYLSLVAASSIIRPGVARSGMMREYIQRFHNPDGFQYLHPVMKEQLQETYGVMVYQEDVLKVCHHFAGLDLADADVLRRMMSGKGKNKKQIAELTQKFFDNCLRRGYSDSLTREVWRQIESFAGYSFSKAHSASYAVESYQSLFLKAHYPLEFMVAVINNFGGFYSTWVYVNEARKAGGKIHLPCINHSLHTTTLYGTDVFLGFIHIQNLEGKYAAGIPEERLRNGSFRDMEMLIRRTGISLDQLRILIRAGALRFTGKTKKELLWEAHMLVGTEKKELQAIELFRETPKIYELPDLSAHELEDAYDETELLGFPVSISSFEMLKTSFRGECRASELSNYIGKKVRMTGNYVTAKYVRTVRGEIMYFGTFLDPEGNFFDTTHFPPSVKNFPLQGRGLYLILGKVVAEFGFPSIEVEKLAKLPIKPDPRS
jgi:error-prone DNA polymerase